jgi:cbb3-type cytochrome oxidase subunit 3
MMDFFVKYSPIISLILFLTIFCVVIFIVFRPKNKKEYNESANIPLKDDEDDK